MACDVSPVAMFLNTSLNTWMQLMDFVFVRGPFGPGDGGGAEGLHWLISDRAKVPHVLIIVDKL